MSVRDQVPPPLFGNNSSDWLQISAMGPTDTNPWELYADYKSCRSAFFGGVAPQDNKSNSN